MATILLESNSGGGTVSQWDQPRKEIRNLFNFDDRLTNSNKESFIFSDEELDKLPSTLMKVIRRTDALLEQTEQARKSAIEANNELKAIQNLMVRYAKRLLKDANKTETKNVRQESGKGFHRLCKLSNQMCEFLNVPEGTQKSRVEVNQYINDYIKANNLYNDRQIVPDEVLASILSDQANGNKITYFSIQKYIKHHFG